MTIDDAIETLKDTNSFGTADIAKSVAIETMRKYQKIEQIVNAELENFHPLDRNPYKIALIKKVIEE